MNLFYSTCNFITLIFIDAIKFYQLTLGQCLPRVCRFEPTCSNYAIQALTHYGIIKGIWKSIIRIIRCNPFSEGGYDPVIKEIKEQ